MNAWGFLQPLRTGHCSNIVWSDPKATTELVNWLNSIHPFEGSIYSDWKWAFLFTISINLQLQQDATKINTHQSKHHTKNIKKSLFPWFLLFHVTIATSSKLPTTLAFKESIRSDMGKATWMLKMSRELYPFWHLEFNLRLIYFTSLILYFQ